MSRYINVASVLFGQESLRGQSYAREAILCDIAENMEQMRGYDLDLAVFSEGVEALAQTMEQAEELNHPGEVLKLYMDFARREQCHVAGSVKLREGNSIYNSIAFIAPDGRPLGAYHKVFLTAGEIEIGHRPGPQAFCVDTAIGRLGGAICFDLNFERLRHQYREIKPDILCFSSMYHGGLAQAWWAYECRAFFVSAVQFHGGGILDPFGRPVKLTDCYTSIARARINLDRVMVHLDMNRTKFADIERKYLGEVAIDIPANIGSALLYSLTDKRTAMDVAKEFGLILLDDYLRGSIALNDKHR